MRYLDESHILIFLIQFLLLLGLAKGLGEVFRRWRQPSLTAEMLVGIILGPTILGRLWPALHHAIFPANVIQVNMLETVAWIGVLFLLLESGLEIDFSIAWRQRGSALVIALTDIIVPMAVAFLPCLFIPARFLVPGSSVVIFALFMATVMTISAMPVTAKVFHELNLLKTDVGFLVMSALAVNDIIGWVLFTIVLALFTQGTFNPGFVLLVFAGTVGFTTIALAYGRSLSTRIIDTMHRAQLPEPASSLTFVWLLGMLFGVITQSIGIHALFGFFVAGVVVGEARSLSEETRRIISNMVYAIFVPVFFASIGLKLDFLANFNLWLILFVTAVGIGGRFLGAWIGVRLTRQFRDNRNIIAIAHTPGGMMEIVVALLALESNLITHEVFVAIVFGAVFSSAIMGPWTVAALRRKEKAAFELVFPGEAILISPAVSDRTGVLRVLAAKLAAHAGIDEDTLFGEMDKREQDLSTAIGQGVAVPHVRMAGLAKAVLGFARLPHGVDWNAPDGKPVEFVFMLAAPIEKDAIPLRVMAKVARLMGDDASRARLESVGDPEKVRELLSRALSLS